MDLETYKSTFSAEDAAPGWDAIDQQLAKVYGSQEPLAHFIPPLRYILGGNDPLDGISVYASQSGGCPHWHFVTYGFSELYYNEDALQRDYSKFGFELTFRLLPRPGWEVEKDAGWVVNLLQNLARYIFTSGKWFEPYHWIPANGPIRLNDETLIHGLIFITDPELPETNTPHGKVQFLQMAGITVNETQRLLGQQAQAADIITGLQKLDPLLVCDLDRKTDVV